MVDRSASTSSLPVTHGPETQMLNLKILQNLSQSNIYRDEKSKEGVRSLEKLFWVKALDTPTGRPP